MAVIGASSNPGSVGYTVLKNLIGSGFPGVVYPVNPRHEAVQGIHAYPDVRSLPCTPDLAIISVPQRPLYPICLSSVGKRGSSGSSSSPPGSGKSGKRVAAWKSVYKGRSESSKG
ncbi:MAG: CoA-binding protein [Candidatus Bipolaricaulaceae bacterium]